MHGKTASSPRSKLYAMMNYLGSGNHSSWERYDYIIAPLFFFFCTSICMMCMIGSLIFLVNLLTLCLYTRKNPSKLIYDWSTCCAFFKFYKHWICGYMLQCSCTILHKLRWIFLLLLFISDLCLIFPLLCS